MRAQGGLPGRGALAGGAWKMRGYCAAFPRRILSSLLPHCLPRAHIFPENCFNPTPPGTWVSSPTPSPPQCLQICEPQTWSPHCSPAWPALSPKKGNLQLLSGACRQLPLVLGPSVLRLLSVPLPLWVLPLMWLDPLHPYPGVAWGPPLGTACRPSTRALWVVISSVWLPLSILFGL